MQKYIVTSNRISHPLSITMAKGWKSAKHNIQGYNVDTIKITVDAARLATEAKSKQIKTISKDSDFSVDDINLIGITLLLEELIIAIKSSVIHWQK